MSFRLRRRLRRPDPGADHGPRSSRDESERHAEPASAGASLSAAVALVAQWSLRLLLIAGAVVAVFYVVGQLWIVVMPVLLALILATVLWPPTRVLRRVMPPTPASGLVILVGVTALFGVGVGLTRLVAAEGEDLADAVVTGLEDLQDWTTGPPLNLGDDQFGDLLDRAMDELQGRAQDIAALTLSGVSTAGSLLLTAVLAVVMCFFFLKDGPAFLPWLARWLAPTPAKHTAELSVRSWNVLGGFIRAQAAVGLADAVGIGLGLAVLGVPLVLPLAVLTFVGAFIPIIGAFVAGALAVLVALVTKGPTVAVMVIVLVLIVQQLESNVLSPLLMGRAMRLHGALVILAVTAGGSLAGVGGAFLAVPALAVATTLLRYAKEQVDRREPLTAENVE